MLLNRPGRSILVKMALCDFREYNIECVHYPVEVIADEVDTEHQELSAQKEVCEVDLQQQINKIEEFAENHFGCPVPIHLDVLHESDFNPLKLKLDIFCRVNQHVGKRLCTATCYLFLQRRSRVNYVRLVDLHVFVFRNELREENRLQANHQTFDLSTFPRSPEEMRQVEADGLREQHKRHPLVVRVVLDLIIGIDRADSGVRNRLLLKHRLVEVTNLFHDTDKTANEKKRLIIEQLM